jgi:GNAT superfamily N-acetyltransferase
MKSNNIKQWSVGMFCSPEGRQKIQGAIAEKEYFMIEHHSPTTENGTPKPMLAGMFILSATDPFDKALWDDVEDWTDALYLHRLIFLESYRGVGLTAKVIEFAEDKVKEAGKHYLRLDCIGSSERLRQFYRERCRGDGKGGLRELNTKWEPALEQDLARFESRVVP